MHKGKYASISIKYKTFFSVILIIATLYGNCIYGQNENQIIGIVQGSNEELLMGNVLLLSNQDSTLVKGAFYMDGVIKIERPTEAGLLLRITSMGYSDTTLVLKNSQGELNLGTITLNESTLSLEEVSINGSRPLIVQSTNGTTTAHVQNTLLSSSTSINELLSKLPNLIADETGISVLGKGEPLYYLNGKRISQNQLTSMQVNQISQVEIINNPSAKYDAQGKAVVNIISIVNTRDGMQGNIMQNTSLAKHLLSYTDMNLHWRKGKWAIAADYGIDRGQHWGANLLKRETLNSENNSYFTNDFESNSKSRYVAKYRLGTSYQIDKKSNISIEYLGAQNIRDQNSQATTVFSDDSEIGSTINATTKGTLSNLSNAINANYNMIIDTLGSNLFIGAQYARFVSDDESIIDEIISNNWNIASATRLNLSSSSIQYIIGQFDLEKLLREETIINIGAKITRANNTGLVDFFSKFITSIATATTKQYISIPALSVA